MRKEKAKCAYEDWLHQAEEKYRLRGFGYCDSPKPTLCNPVEWVGPCDQECKSDQLYHKQPTVLCKITTKNKHVIIQNNKKSCHM